MIAVMAGCGGVEIRQITRQNPYEKGLRFYRPHPYLWVTKDKSGGLQGSIIWLPDKSQEYVAKVRSGLGKVDIRFTLENGWNLTGFNEARESPTAQMITAASTCSSSMSRRASSAGSNPSSSSNNRGPRARPPRLTGPPSCDMK
jgi:hypothetical protein